MKRHATLKRPMRAKLIFNPSAGRAGELPIQQMNVVHEMQAWNMVPETYLVEPGSDLPGAVHDALDDGIRMYVVWCGDGTISPIAGMLAGIQATLGVIPISTQNNTALSLSTPVDIPSAVAILRTGRCIKVDVGMATCGKMNTSFLEVCSVGLVSTGEVNGHIWFSCSSSTTRFLLKLFCSRPGGTRCVFGSSGSMPKGQSDCTIRKSDGNFLSCN